MAPKRSSAPRSSRRATKASSWCTTAFVLVGVPVGLGICTRPMWPAGWADQVVEAATPVAAGAAVATTSVALLALSVSSGRGMRRRRWARAVEQAGLTRSRLGEQLVPKLVSSSREGGELVWRVRMLTGQTPQDWDRRAQRLAAELGAGKARVAWSPDRIEEIELRLTRKQAA
ncbi:hypothetical protein AB0L97_34800 [Nocardia sp. NPDC051911]|uniref:hypothetical protein n=1 Tax=Nocardia sp. NPDC051911 TaxID=3154648 RepID=UPI00343F707C